MEKLFAVAFAIIIMIALLLGFALIYLAWERPLPETGSGNGNGNGSGTAVPPFPSEKLSSPYDCSDGIAAQAIKAELGTAYSVSKSLTGIGTMALNDCFIKKEGEAVAGVEIREVPSHSEAVDVVERRKNLVTFNEEILEYDFSGTGIGMPATLIETRLAGMPSGDKLYTIVFVDSSKRNVVVTVKSNQERPVEKEFALQVAQLYEIII